jgi:hypothetical protein
MRQQLTMPASSSRTRPRHKWMILAGFFKD